MTTTTERLEQLAQEHEQKAAALRLAAAELNGHQTEKTRGRINGQMQAAIKLRREQVHEVPRTRTRQSSDQTQQLLHDLLTQAPGPMSANELRDALAERGLDFTRSWVQKMVIAIPGVRKTGMGRTGARYMLGAPRTRSGKPHKNANPDKARAIVAILRDAGQPLTTKELAPLARAQGVDQLTGIANYVKAGYLKRVSRGGKKAYAFAAMPEEAPAS